MEFTSEETDFLTSIGQAPSVQMENVGAINEMYSYDRETLQSDKKYPTFNYEDKYKDLGRLKSKESEEQKQEVPGMLYKPL